MNIMSTGLWGIGWVIAELRLKKLLKRLAATPMRRWHFLVAFAAVRLIFLAVEGPFLIGFGVLVFGTPFRGSALLLALAGPPRGGGLLRHRPAHRLAARRTSRRSAGSSTWCSCR